MAHARRRLLDEVISLLTNLAVTGTRVYEDPAAAISDESLPALIVEANDEEVSPLGDYSFGDAGYRQVRRLSLNITCVAKSASQRDQSALEVEEALMRSEIADMREIERSSFDSTADGNFRLWSAALVFRLTYQTESHYPRVAVR